MNKETAKHLNGLRADAQPLKFDDSDAVAILGTYEARSRLASWITDRAAAWSEQATSLEIQAAAKERREASVRNGISVHLYQDRIVVGCYDGMAEQQWALMEPEVQAYMDADNKQRLDAYERYRALCEQGVALPPSE